METTILSQFLSLYVWFPLAAFLMLMLLIARFYQKFSGEQTHYWLYILPIVAFGFVAVRGASANRVESDIVTSLVAAVAGLVLLFLAVRLYQRMMSPQSPDGLEETPTIQDRFSDRP